MYAKHFVRHSGAEIDLRSTRCQRPLSVCSGCHNERAPAGWLTQQKFIFLQLWNREDLGVSGAGFSRDLSPLLADAASCHVRTRSFLRVHPWCLSVCFHLLFSSGHGQMTLDTLTLTPLPHLKALSPNAVTLWRLQHMDLGWHNTTLEEFSI